MGAPVPAEVGDVQFPDFEQQCEAFLAAEPLVVSSIMGLFPAAFVSRLKDRRIAWFACVTTLAEAREAERAGADAVVAQGHEAGGHRGSFDQAAAERQGVGLMALVPRLSDKLSIPIFVCQTFHEFAQQSTRFSSWADQFYKRQREKGKSHHSAIRSLAFKWIRIVFACWKANKPYDESLYTKALAKRNSSPSST